jgi:RNA polymerase sigma-70 factor (ECF subfamily)
VFGALDRYERSRPFRPWLFGIALNQGRDVLRRRSARAPETGDEATLSALRAERDAFEQLAEQSAISVALDAVEEPFREALVLVDVVGFGYEDAADTLGCALGTVKSRVHRGRESFRAAYTRAAAGATARQTSAGKGTGSDQGERNAPKAFGRSVT